VQNITYNKGLIFRIYKDFNSSIAKKIKTWTKNLNRYLSKYGEKEFLYTVGEIVN
jgi:hypothetical protein